MKILLVTNLYPCTTNLDKDPNTKALYNITKFWNEDVEVIRPLFLPTEFKGLIAKTINTGKRTLINNIPVHVLPILKVPKTNIYFYEHLIRYVKKKKISPDVVISHRLHCITGAAKLAKRYKKPLIIGLHNSDVLLLQNYKMQKYYSNIFEQAAYIACRSHSILKEITKIYPQYTHKFFVAFSGIERSIIASSQNIISKVLEWITKRRPIRFITAARLIKSKNIDVNLRALSRLKDTIKWEYLIIGEGSEMTNLRKLTSDLGLGNKVSFLGKKSREEVLRYMENSDIFIMVSAPETFGLAYLEAMANGCLIVGAYDNGIDGIIRDGENGFLCKPGLDEELSKKLQLIINMSKKDLLAITKRGNRTLLKYTEENSSWVYLEKIKEAYECSKFN